MLGLKLNHVSKRGPRCEAKLISDKFLMLGMVFRCEIFLSSMTFPWLLMIFQKFHDFPENYIFPGFPDPVGTLIGYDDTWLLTQVLDTNDFIWCRIIQQVYNRPNIRRHILIILLHKSQNAPVPYPTMCHFVTGICTRVHISVTKWGPVEYVTSALWDLWDGLFKDRVSRCRIYITNIRPCHLYKGYSYIAKTSSLYWNVPGDTQFIYNCYMTKNNADPGDKYYFMRLI